MSDQERYQQLLAILEGMQQQLAAVIGPPDFPKQQLADLEWQDAVQKLRKEEFSFIMDLRNMAFPEEANTDTFFGQHLLHVKSFLMRVHPAFLEPYLRWGGAAYEMVLDPAYAGMVSSRRFIYRILIPMRFNPFPGQDYEDNFYWVLQTARPYRLDKEQRMAQQMNLYRVLKKFEPGDLTTFRAEICHDDGLITDEETTSLLLALCNSLYQVLGEEAGQILDAYIDGAKSAKEVAERLGKPVDRVGTVQKTILRYANEWYPWKRFTMAKQFAKYLAEIRSRDGQVQRR